MQSDAQLNADPRRQWFTLDELLSAVLADVIATDANFQLAQAAAWRGFARSVNELHKVPQITAADISVGFGRLENLGLNELDLDLDLERFTPGWIRRCWWGFLFLVFRVAPKPRPARFRLTRASGRAGVRLRIKVRRNRQGNWEIDSQPDRAELAVA